MFGSCYSTFPGVLGICGRYSEMLDTANTLGRTGTLWVRAPRYSILQIHWDGREPFGYISRGTRYCKYPGKPRYSCLRHPVPWTPLKTHRTHLSRRRELLHRRAESVPSVLDIAATVTISSATRAAATPCSSSCSQASTHATAVIRYGPYSIESHDTQPSRYDRMLSLIPLALTGPK